ncbi:MAG: hypothetical protein K9G26_09935 [Emcibacter sp.]|nr:hypothetical protein [Emcibacter sp.]
MRAIYDIVEQQLGISYEQIDIILENYIDLLKDIPPYEKYHYRSPDLLQFYEKTALSDYVAFHKLVLLKLIKKFQPNDLTIRFPDTLLSLYQIEFDRIKSNIEQDSDYVFDWKNDVFTKDLGICCGRLFPIGSCVVEISGIPRIMLFRKGIGQFLKMAYFLLFKIKARKPVLATHIHTPNLNNFSPEGWEKSYAVVAEIFKLNPELTAMMRMVWYMDPVISEISPKLSYLREIPTQNGAEIFFHNTEGIQSSAFARSKKRKLLFEAGKYIPKVYYLVWPREALIKYVESRREL